MRRHKDLAHLLAHRRQLVDGEEAPVVDLLAGGAEGGEAVRLGVQQAVESIEAARVAGVAVVGTHRLRQRLRDLRRGGDQVGQAALGDELLAAALRDEIGGGFVLEREAGDESFAVVPINIDLGDVEKPKAFYTETKLTALPFFRDETMGVFNDLKKAGVAFGLPVTLLVDADGCARAAMNGAAHWSSPDALALVDVLKRASTMEPQF